MKKTIVVIVFLLFCIPLTCFPRSYNLWRIHQDEMTDSSPMLTIVVDSEKYTDVVVDVVTDKGTSIVITPVLNYSGNLINGEDSATTIIPNGGRAQRVIYSKISAPRCKVTVTKTESGSTSNFVLSIRGVE